MAIVREFGLPVALVGFFVWQGWVRERRMGRRMDATQDFVQRALVGLVSDNTKAMEAVGKALEARPCLAEAELHDRLRELAKDRPTAQEVHSGG